MKLLLTSAGLTTPEIRQALLYLAGKPAVELSVAFVPTAANLEPGDKRWLIDDLVSLREERYRSIDVVDISALPRQTWTERLEQADIIVVGGGNTYHLLHWARQSGFADALLSFLHTKVYVGISAGSILVGASIASAKDDASAAQQIGEDPGDAALQLVDFVVKPHLGNKDFPEVTKEKTEAFAKKSGLPTYLLDDTSAVIVDGDAVTTIGQEHYFFEGSKR